MKRLPLPPAPIVPLRRRGVMLILSSPSGAGKTTLSRRLFEVTPQMQMSISVTTRPRRPAEISGRDYHFIDQETFDRYVKNGDLLEQAEVYGYCYGTPKTPVLRALESGMDVLFDIDWQGTRQIMRQSRADLVTIFILPPSMAELERRLRTRAQDSDEVVAKRMAKAYEEVSHWREYDYTLVNEDIETSLACVRAILTAERLKRKRQIDLPTFVAALQAKPPSIG